MAQGPAKYASLDNRLAKLRQHLLAFLPPPPQSNTTYSDQELDMTRSYIVLAHAEIEAFCEDLARTKIQLAKQTFDRQQRITPVLRRILSYFVGKNRRSWSEVLSPSPQIVSSAIQSYLEEVHKNNGVKRKDIEKLFFPLGILDTNLNATWLAQMDSFGGERGGCAHQSHGAYNPPDPVSSLNTINQLSQGLRQLEGMVRRIR